MAEPENKDGAPRSVHIEKKKTNWLAWAALALGVLALLLALSRCDRDAPVAVVAPAPVDAAPAVTTPVAIEKVTLPGGGVIDLAPATLNYELQRYLASADPAPRTFTFDKLNFDTNASTIRAEDAPTLAALGQILAAYPKAKVTLVGYADARGADATNARLGETRAQAVMQALTGNGIAANRITAVTGGEANPAATNATPDGQFENRRTELVVTAK